MSHHHSDQMSQRSQVSGSLSKVTSFQDHSLLFESDGRTLVGIELSQTKSGQLKKENPWSSPPVLHYGGFQRGRLSHQPVYKKVSHFSQKHTLCHQTFADIFPFKWCCSYLGVRTVGAVLWGMIMTTWSVSDHFHCHCDRRKTRLNVTLLYSFLPGTQQGRSQRAAGWRVPCQGKYPGQRRAGHPR